MTRSGIEHDLTKSPYNYVGTYSNGNKVIFYFSSNGALNNFILKCGQYYCETYRGLCNRYRMKFKISKDVCDIQLYRRLERRGFLINLNGVDVKWPDRLRYDGTKIVIEDLVEQ